MTDAPRIIRVDSRCLDVGDLLYGWNGDAHPDDPPPSGVPAGVIGSIEHGAQIRFRFVSDDWEMEMAARSAWITPAVAYTAEWAAGFESGVAEGRKQTSTATVFGVFRVVDPRRTAEAIRQVDSVGFDEVTAVLELLDAAREMLTDAGVPDLDLPARDRP